MAVREQLSCPCLFILSQTNVHSPDYSNGCMNLKYSSENEAFSAINNPAPRGGVFRR